MPPGYKDGSDWFASFNPGTKHVLDVSLGYTLMPERCIFFVLYIYHGLSRSIHSVVSNFSTKTLARYHVVGAWVNHNGW